MGMGWASSSSVEADICSTVRGQRLGVPMGIGQSLMAAAHFFNRKDTLCTYTYQIAATSDNMMLCMNPLKVHIVTCGGDLVRAQFAFSIYICCKTTAVVTAPVTEPTSCEFTRRCQGIGQGQYCSASGHSRQDGEREVPPSIRGFESLKMCRQRRWLS